jgi:hypothetical protein
MPAAFGFKAHSGWAALVVVGGDADRARVLDRRRVELVDEGESWAKAPYHAAEELPPADARALVARSLKVARRNTTRALEQEIRRAADAGHPVGACAVLMGTPMPPWSTDEILAVHFRMHKAEGVMWRAAIAEAAIECGLRLVPVAEKRLGEEARRALGATPAAVARRLGDLGQGLGPPWGKDQKDAALAALIALTGKIPRSG